MEPVNSRSRIFGLDIMRAAAITFVMLSHGNMYSGKLADPAGYRWVFLDGVGLFFVLSGFLIGGILIRTLQNGDLRPGVMGGFWMRRWLRTLPAYFAVLTFLLCCYAAVHGHLPPAWIRYYTFTQNLVTPHPLFFAEAWSLSVEEWFYLIVPLSLFLAVRFPAEKKWTIIVLIVVFIVVVTGIRLHRADSFDPLAGNFGEEIVKVVVTRLDSIMYGVLAAWLAFYYPAGFARFRKPLLVGGLILLFASNFDFGLFYYTRIRYSLVPLITIMLLPFLSTFRKEDGLAYRIITFISLISYSMYLTNHMIVQRGMLPVITRTLGLDLAGNPTHNLVAYLLFWILTIVAATVLYRVIEKPFMDLRRRWEG